ncbi:MAG TPA: molybdopterin-dependent oxidoreductase [Desulfatiglandales bacterium]|nr:molybdopterin-dependent oxidoreductase [Desulfatiglandales bacterium]
MEFSRRNFIKFAVGGLGGTLLSPLPWKLMDDIAIWTQNWPWVPVPARGKISMINTVCTLCTGACGITAKKVGNRVVKIEGRNDYPLNQGAVCPLGMAGPQILYNEGIRWTGPMKRVGPKGSDKWKEISWDEAIAELAARIKGLRDTGKPGKLAAIDGSQSRSTMALLVKRLIESVGSPNYMPMQREEDTYSLVNFLMQGGKGPVWFDLENSDFIISFGASLLDGWGAPGRMLSAWREWSQKGRKNKTYLVQIDPRASNTSAKADNWLAPFPGTEAALALGIAHVIIKENRHNAEFVENNTFGFNDWSDAKGVEHKGFSKVVLEKYSPQAVEDITGVDKSLIIDIARRFSMAKAPIAISGRGKGNSPGGLYEFMAVHSLNALMGRINQKGGVLTTDDLPMAQLPDVTYDETAKDGLSEERVDLAGTARYPFAKSLINKFAEITDSRGISPVDTLLIFSANPAHNIPMSNIFARALEKIPFTVSFSPFKDETSLLADLIMPDHTHLEKVTDIVWPEGIQYPFYALSKPVAEPIYRTRHSGDVVISLAQKIGGTVAGSFQWTNFEELLQERVKGLFDSGRGLTSYNESEPIWKKLDSGQNRESKHSSFKSMWDEIKENGFWCMPAHDYGRWPEIFNTPSKKFEFFSVKIESAIENYASKIYFGNPLRQLAIYSSGDEVYMPHYEKIDSIVDEKEYPLVLFPIEFINISSGWIGNPPFLNKTLQDYQFIKDDLLAEVNPETASRYDLKEGARVIVRSSKGEIKVRIHLFDGAMPGVIFIPTGFGHTAYDKYLKGKGANPFTIIDQVEGPLSGEPIWWNTRVKVIKI